jgi:hypothetical protein
MYILCISCVFRQWKTLPFHMGTKTKKKIEKRFPKANPSLYSTHRPAGRPGSSENWLREKTRPCVRTHCLVGSRDGSVVEGFSILEPSS